MARTRTVAVSTGATLITTGRDGFMVVSGAGTVYLGGADVDASTKGNPIAQNGVINFAYSGGGDGLYGVTSTGTSNVIVTESEFI